jgi:hypothetical protein
MTCSSASTIIIHERKWWGSPAGQSAEWLRARRNTPSRLLQVQLMMILPPPRCDVRRLLKLLHTADEQVIIGDSVGKRRTLSTHPLFGSAILYDRSACSVARRCKILQGPTNKGKVMVIYLQMCPSTVATMADAVARCRQCRSKTPLFRDVHNRTSSSS